MNREAVLDIAGILETGAPYGQERMWADDPDVPGRACPMCIAAHAIAWRYGGFAEYAHAIGTAAGRLDVDMAAAVGILDLDGTQRMALFQSFPHGGGRSPTRAEAVAMLRSFAETGQVDWKAMERDDRGIRDAATEMPGRKRKGKTS